MLEVSEYECSMWGGERREGVRSLITLAQIPRGGGLKSSVTHQTSIDRSVVMPCSITSVVVVVVDSTGCSCVCRDTRKRGVSTIEVGVE